MPQFDRYELGISLHGVECFLKTFEEIGQDLKNTIYMNIIKKQGKIQQRLRKGLKRSIGPFT